MTAGQFFANRWWVVAASFVELMVGTGSILVFTFGVFLKPVTQEFGWTRGQFSSALAATTIFSLITTPIFGKLVDRWGIRTVALPATVVFALAVAGLSLMPPVLLVVDALYLVAFMFGASQGPMIYSKAVSAWFDSQRGLALGIATAGVGLGTTLMPLLAQFLIDRYGWRVAYVGLGVMIMLLGFSAVALFVRDPPDMAPRARRAQTTRAELPGMTAMEALRGSWRFRALALVILLGGISINGTLAHVVALLTDRGATPQVATATLSAAGIAIILGRIGSGYFLDRLHGPYVAATSMLLPALGVALLASGMRGIVPLIGVLLCGIGVGAEIDMLAFFISRYFGLRAFGQIYGYIFPAFAIGVGLGPYLMGLCYDRLHSYGPMLAAFTVALVINAALLARFGPYPYPRTRSTNPLGASIG